MSSIFPLAIFVVYYHVPSANANVIRSIALCRNAGGLSEIHENHSLSPYRDPAGMHADAGTIKTHNHFREHRARRQRSRVVFVMKGGGVQKTRRTLTSKTLRRVLLCGFSLARKAKLREPKKFSLLFIPS